MLSHSFFQQVLLTLPLQIHPEFNHISAPPLHPPQPTFHLCPWNSFLHESLPFLTVYIHIEARGSILKCYVMFCFSLTQRIQYSMSLRAEVKWFTNFHKTLCDLIPYFLFKILFPITHATSATLASMLFLEATDMTSHNGLYIGFFHLLDMLLQHAPLYTQVSPMASLAVPSGLAQWSYLVKLFKI